MTGHFLDSASCRTGRIKWYSIEKQFGFILTDEGNELFFYHGSIVYRDVVPGSCEHNRGICARALSLLNDENLSEIEVERRTHQFNTRKCEKYLEGERVIFRVFESPRGLEARSVKRAT